MEQTKNTIRFIFELLTCIGLSACGVKGPPQPPKEPPPIGRGLPKYYEASKKIENKYNKNLEKKDNDDSGETAPSVDEAK